MAESLGSLVDKLSVVNIKMFFVQDRVHQAAREGQGLDPETTAQVVSLNVQRNGLINELNQLGGGAEPIIKLMDIHQADS